MAIKSRTYPTPGQFFNLQVSLDSQDTLGWLSFIKEFPSNHWQAAQTCYLEWLGSRKSGRWWMTALIRKFWPIACDIWDVRNGIVHARETNEASVIRDTAITAEFASGTA
jgi:hypothetical protein